MEPTNFLGIYQLALDDSGEMHLPSEISEQMEPEKDGGEMILLCNQDDSMQLYPDAYFHRMIRHNLRYMRSRSRGQHDYDVEGYSKLVPVIFYSVYMDREGNVKVPDRVREELDLYGDMTLVGCRESLQLWKRDDWDRHEHELFTHAN